MVVQVFKLLKGYKKRRAVISASFFLEGKPQEFRDETGLVSGHAYSVLQARSPSLAFPFSLHRSPRSDGAWYSHRTAATGEARGLV
jgi:hypothetical protein